MYRPLSRLLGAAVFAHALVACDDEDVVRVPGEPELCIVNEDGTEDRCSRLDLALDFGAVLVDEKLEKKLLLKNVGRADYTLLDSEYEGDPSPDFSIPVTRTVLALGDEVPLSAIFHPTAEGELATTVNLRFSEATTDVFPVRLTGRGVKGDCAIEPGGVVDFGAVATGDAFTGKVVLRNQTDLPWDVTIGEIGSETDPDAFAFEDFEPGVYTVDARGELEVPITFRPNHLGTHSGVLNIPAPSICQPHVLMLQGKGVEQIISWQPRPLDFGFVDVTERVTAAVVFTNASNMPVQITDLEVDDASGAFSLEDRGVTSIELPPGGVEVPVYVAFQPTDLGLHTGSLTFKTSAESMPTGSAALRGHGGGPKIHAAPKTLSFGQVGVGSWQVRRVVVANVGSDDPSTSEDNLKLETVWHEWAPATGHNFTAELDGYDAAGIRAGSAVDVRVKFTPQSLGTQQALLRIFSNDPDQPVTEIQVTAEGVDLPPCDYRVIPPDLRFEQLDPGESDTQSFVIENTGTEACIVSTMELGRTTASAFSLPSRPTMPATIPPGESLEVEVKFAPVTADIFSGYVEMFVNSPTDPQIRVRLNGASKTGCLLIAPETLDFGVHRPGCSGRAKTFSVYNTCSTNVTLTNIGLASGTGSDFTIVSRPSTPYFIRPGDSVEISANYRPSTIGQDSDSITIQTAELSHPYVVSLSGAGASTPIQTDVFTQSRQAKVDILFVIDDSGSMDDKQTSLSQNFAAFMSHAQANLDYHIAVTSTTVCNEVKCNNISPSLAPDGRFAPKDPEDVPSPATRVISSSSPDPEQLFAQNVQVGIGGSGTEQALAAMEKALSPSRLGSHNAGFLRPDAYLAVILVTDTRDQSPGSVSRYYNSLLSVVGPRRINEFSVSGIIPTPAGPSRGCVYDEESKSINSTRLIDLINMTGGIYDNICTPDWANTLEQLSRRLFGMQSHFPLTSFPDVTAGSQPMTVKVNGVEVPQSVTPGDGGWTWDSTANSIRFDESNTPEPGDTVSVVYQVACM